MTFEQKSVELLKKKQLERYRKSFRRWFDLLRKLEPDYQEEQLEMMIDGGVMEKAKSKNQCQGCQSGWEIEEHKPWPRGSKIIYFHKVPGGYKHEKVMCTSKYYAQ